MKNKNNASKKKKCNTGGCGCGIQTGGQCATCKMKGGGFAISPTSYFPSSNNTYHSLNNHNNDPTMFEYSSRMQGVPISNTHNIKGGNDTFLGGGKRRRKNKKSRKIKSLRYKKMTKKQRGGINLGYIAQNSLLGHGQYGTWFGAPTVEPPEWNSSIFTKPLNSNTYGFSENNKYLV